MASIYWVNLSFLTFQAYIQHPDVHSARANRDFVLKQMSEALQTIYGAAEATGKSEPNPLETPGALSGALDNFDVSIVVTETWKINEKIIKNL